MFPQCFRGVVFDECAPKAIAPVDDIHSARKDRLVGCFPVEIVAMGLGQGAVVANGHREHLEVRAPGETEKAGIIRFGSHDAGDRGAMGIRIRVVIGSLFVWEVLENRLRYICVVELAVREIDTGIHDRDRHAVARLCARAIFHGESGVGLMRVDLFQGWLAEEIRVGRTPTEFFVGETVCSDIVAAGFEFTPRDAAMDGSIDAGLLLLLRRWRSYRTRRCRGSTASSTAATAARQCYGERNRRKQACQPVDQEAHPRPFSANSRSDARAVVCGCSGDAVFRSGMRVLEVPGHPVSGY